ncbi:MAG: hypothetical protein IJR93_13175 [Treponema sp.]|nr:hypothetical protein [Treponema sp.]
MQVLTKKMVDAKINKLVSIAKDMLNGCQVPFSVSTFYETTNARFTFWSRYCSLDFILNGQTDPSENEEFVSLSRKLVNVTRREFEGLCLDFLAEVLKEKDGAGTGDCYMKAFGLRLISIDAPQALPEELKTGMIDYHVREWLKSYESRSRSGEYRNYRDAEYESFYDPKLNTFNIQMRRGDYVFRSFFDVGDALYLLSRRVEKFRFNDLMMIAFQVGCQCVEEGILDPEYVQKLCGCCGYQLRHMPLVGISIQDGNTGPFVFAAYDFCVFNRGRPAFWDTLLQPLT